ncbi:Uncharacterized protein TCM_016317 [Theobroma cacao]|uniref:Uncharacterized protein n=1 Tax=Theobroma cacao TaxID=3641 RepID=A0A061GCQ1_THECC|nr:Uncharacterized protein TCM_016317 [Theobroma cacao]
MKAFYFGSIANQIKFSGMIRPIGLKKSVGAIPSCNGNERAQSLMTSFNDKVTRRQNHGTDRREDCGEVPPTCRLLDSMDRGGYRKGNVVDRAGSTVGPPQIKSSNGS